MDIELVSALKEPKLNIWKAFLARAGLTAEEDAETTVLLWDEDNLIATGSRRGNVLKYIAVDESRRGEDLTAKVLTALRQDAFSAGHRHLFLYTKPGNKWMFSSLFFYPIAQTESVLLMEDKKDGISQFLSSLPAPAKGEKIGAAVMNCNPFTLGHRFLIDKGANECDHLYVFVLSEEAGPIQAKDRLEMVKLGTKDIPNVTVLPTGPYLISAATFPTYFLKERDKAAEVQCALDIAIFAQYFARHFHITHRFVGQEPLSPMTQQYNEQLKALLPQTVVEIPRLEQRNTPISATAVRAAMELGDHDTVKKLVPQTTYDYLRKEGYL